MTVPAEHRIKRIRHLTNRFVAGIVAVLVLAPVSALAAPPSNDNFADGTPISQLPFTTSQDTAEATEEAGEPRPMCAPIGKTVWFRYTPAEDGLVQADTEGSDFDTVLAIWTGEDLNGLDQVACSDDSGSGLDSLVTFSASAGTTYLFQVGGYHDETGSLALRVGPPTSGSISGTVTSDTGQPLPSVCVQARFAPSGQWAGWAETNSMGSYTLSGLDSGSYHIHFFDRCDSQRGHQAEWFDDQPSQATATEVAVTSPEATSGIDAELTSLPLGSISGTVTSDTGAPLPNICVDLVDATTGDYAGWTETGNAGSYTLGAPEGTYHVYFYDGCDDGRNHESEWFDNQTYATATEVVVTPPDDTPGIDAELTSLGSISGTVTSDTGEPLADICVEVYDATSSHWTAWAGTDSAGSYTAYVPEGTHHVLFSDGCDALTDHAEEWFDDQPTQATATGVVVTGNGATSGIDAELTRLTLGSIAGTVTSDTGEPLANICVDVYDAVTGRWEGWGETNSSGSYSASVPEGTYQVNFSDWCDNQTDHEEEWFDDQPSQSMATRVTVTGESTTSGIDAELTSITLGTIAGTVTDDAGEPLARICVEVYDAATGQWAGWGQTNSSGTYSASVPEGTHHVSFTDWCDIRTDHQGEWFDDQPTRATATGVVVTGEATTSGIDAELAPFRLSVSRTGPGSGSVTSQPGGISCGTDCEEIYREGTRVTLAATADPGSVFQAWTGCGQTFGNQCSVTMDQARSVTATFGVEAPSLDTTITSGPPNPGSGDATFEFTATDASATFACSLDGAAFSACSSPWSYSGLTDGDHVFRVRATNSIGYTDPSPAEWAWTVDTTVVEPGTPQTAITAGPSGVTTSRAATFGFSASEAGSRFECSIDGKAFQTCSSPWSYSSLEEGAHVFRVRASHNGKADPTPAERTWVVDANGPEMSIRRPTAGAYVNDQSVGGTGPIVVVGSVAVEATAADLQSGVSGFRFEVDGIPVDPAAVTRQGDTYRFTYRPVVAGEHTITARATNGSGLVSSITRSVYGIPAG